VANDATVDWGNIPVYPDPQSWGRNEAPLDTARLVYTEEEPDYYLDVLSETEAKLYDLMVKHKWKVACLKDVIRLMKDAHFDPMDIAPNLHEKVQKLIAVSTVCSGRIPRMSVPMAGRCLPDIGPIY
jgi:hypothetical protein